MSSSRDDRHTFVDFDGLEEDVTAEEPAAPQARFRVDDEIARGGLGRVHRGYDLALDREVAIKALLKASPAARARFERETLLTARLQHPNIVPVYDGGRDDDGEPYLAMRLVHGASLTEAIDGRATLEERLDLLPHVIDVCNAIAYAHSQRIAHRDLKPDNILVGDFGEAVVIDWGIAKDLDADDDPTAAVEPETPTITGLSSHSTLTRVGSVVGTPAYMPPEQAAGQSVEERADVYALGAVLYHVLAGVRPYHDEEDTLASVLAGPPVSVEEITPGIPPDLVAIVAKAMARLPVDRYADARELARDLNRFRKGRFVSAYAYTPQERLIRFVRAHPVSIGLSVALILAVVAGVALLGWSHTVVEAERAAAVAARDDLTALQAREQVRLDELTLEQARLVMLERPAEALRLLDSLSGQAVFDGRVRSVAAAAHALHPPVEMDMPLGGPPDAVAVAGDRMVLVKGNEVARHDRGGWRVLTLPDRIRNVELWGDEVVLCASNGAFQMGWDEEVPSRLTSSCRSLNRTTTGVSIRGVTQSAWFDGQLKRFDHLAASGGVTNDGKRWWILTTDGRLVEYDSGVVVGERAASGGYALSLTGDDRWLVRLHEDPALAVLDTRRPNQIRTIDVGVDWLVAAGELSGDHLLVGGAGQQVVAVDLQRGVAVARLDVEGSPVRMDGLPGGRVFLITDAGRAYVIELVDGVLEAQYVATPGQKLRAVGRDGLDIVIVDDTGRMFHQELDTMDGGVMHRHPGRIDGLTVDGTDLWVFGTGGVEQVRDGTVLSRDERPATHVLRCGDGMAFIGPNHLGFWGEPSLATTTRTVAGRCVDGTLVVSTQSGEIILWSRGQAPTRTSVDLDVKAIHAMGAHALLVGRDASARLDLSTGVTTPVDSLPDRSVILSTVRGEDVVYATADALLQGTVVQQALENRPYSLGSGERLWLGDIDGGIHGWRDLTEAAVELTGHRQYVHVLRESPDHGRLASGGWDEMAWIFDVRDPARTSGRPLPGHRAAVLAVAWSPDGTVLYTGDHAGHVRSWRDDLPTDPTELRARIHALAGTLGTSRSGHDNADPKSP